MKPSEVTKALFKINDKPLAIPPRYQELFDTIINRSHPRVNIIAPTQDGKSLTIGCAITLACALFPERWIILAPSDKKADIIMSYIRDFATQNPLIYSQLELDKNDTLDRLKRERSKRHLTFKRGGGVMTLTLDAKNSKRSMEAAMGFGGRNIVADEAGLINDTLWATVMRMLGGHQYKDSFLLKIGNPFFRNHFYRSSQNEKYKQIKLNYFDSIKDRENGHHGFDPEFIEEMKAEAFFDVFYHCEFPDEDTVDADGYRSLITSNEVVWGNAEINGEIHLGCDIGGGGDKSVIVIRGQTGAKVAFDAKTKDTMAIIPELERIVEQYEVDWANVAVDDIGVGRGVSDRLKEMGYNISGVSVGGACEKDKDKLKFSNIRAQLHWEMRDWLKEGNVLEENDIKKLSQIFWARFKVNTDKVLKIMPKDEIKRLNGNVSPDYADALMLSFYKSKQFKMFFV